MQYRYLSGRFTVDLDRVLVYCRAALKKSHSMAAGGAVLHSARARSYVLGASVVTCALYRVRTSVVAPPPKRMPLPMPLPSVTRAGFACYRQVASLGPWICRRRERTACLRLP
jgi:hypothetical protein